MKTTYAYLLGLAALAGCSVVNAPDDAVVPTGNGGGGGATTSSSGGSTTTDGGSGGTGGAGMCGNGTTDPGEDCDDAGPSATCDADCTVAECGDGTLNLQANEACDDGNTDAGDACSSSCATTVFVIDPEGPDDSFTGILMQPSVVVNTAVSPSEFWVAYIHRTTDVADTEVRVLRFDEVGLPIGTPLVLATGNNLGGVRLAINDLGRAIVTWADQTTTDGRYSIIEPDFTVNGTLDNVLIQGSSNLALFPTVASNGDGFCLQFTDNTNDELIVRCFDALGQSGATQNQIVGPNALGFVALYGTSAIFGRNNGYITLRYGTDGKEILGQELTSVGQVVGTAFTVATGPSTSTFTTLIGNAVAANDGSFVVAASLSGPFGNGQNKFRATRRRFTGPANPVQPSPELVTGSHTDEYAPWITMLGNRMLYTYSAAVGNISSECILRAQLFEQGAAMGAAQDVQVPGVEECGVLAKHAANQKGDVFIAWVHLDQEDAAPVGATLRARLYPRLLAP